MENNSNGQGCKAALIIVGGKTIRSRSESIQRGQIEAALTEQGLDLTLTWHVTVLDREHIEEAVRAVRPHAGRIFILSGDSEKLEELGRETSAAPSPL